VPDYNELLSLVAILKKSAATLLGQKYEIADARLNALLSKSVISNPLRFIEDRAVALDTIFDKIVDKTELMLQQKNTELNKVISVIDAMSPLKVMLRGYSVATISGKAVRSVNELKVNDKISLRLSDGSVDCTVTNK
ncbi:MAG: exodeoxyribonuclease VII large subunit, partial [Acutalibacteraceae bacterium]|nr:exodeoxyribonuclease VII large subunit [Acutalibacteraceae bacterium]